MSKKLKGEASTVAGIKGFGAPFGTKAPHKKNPSKPYGEAELFENAVIKALLSGDVNEVVRKRTDNQWAVYDDSTDAQLAVYPTRAAAWARQRQIRQTKKTAKQAASSEKKRQTKSLAPKISRPTPQKAKDKPQVSKAKPKKTKDRPKLAKKPTTAKAARSAVAKQKNKAARKSEIKAILQKVLKEASMVSYIFENPPAEASVWENFIGKLTNEIVLSDQNLKRIMQNAAKTEIRTISRAIDTVGEILGNTGVFEVKKGKPCHDPKTRELRADFEVFMKENNKKLKFAMGLSNGKPLIIFPDESRQAINSMANHESKLLRAEMMHAQETALDIMDDVIKAVQARDKYLSIMEKKIDKYLNEMGPMQIAMLKFLLKKKYKGVK